MYFMEAASIITLISTGHWMESRVGQQASSALRKLTMEFDQQLAATARRMDEITGQVEAKSDAQGKKIVSELQVLESLMREFAGKISHKAKAESVDESFAERRVRGAMIDALRRDSILFTRAYSHTPLTLPSHVSILTGLLPGDHGIRDNVGYRLHHVLKGLAEALRRAGVEGSRG